MAITIVRRAVPPIIDHTITLDDRTQWYQQLFDDAMWQHSNSAITPEQIQTYVESFTMHVLKHSGEGDNGYTTISNIPRIQHFLAMLEWHTERFAQTEPRPWNEVVRYLAIERGATKAWNVGEKVKPQDTTINEYRLRPVLPTPLGVLGTKPKISPPPPPQPPKAGQDIWGKVVERTGRRTWQIKLDTGFAVTAQAPAQFDSQMRENKRVMVRITRNDVHDIRKVQ